MTESASEVGPGSWIAVGLRDAGRVESGVPLGFGAYAEVIHDRLKTEPPGALSQAKLRLLVSVLAGHTSTPDDCFFGQGTVWGYLIRPTRIWTFDDGVARAHDPEPRAEQACLRTLDEPLKLGQDFAYQLFSGPLTAAEMVGNWRDEHFFTAQAPDLIWPQDRAWCVRRDGDSDTIVAGSPALIDQVVAQPELDSRIV